jgi:hypothetical protein
MKYLILQYRGFSSRVPQIRPSQESMYGMSNLAATQRLRSGRTNMATEPAYASGNTSTRESSAENQSTNRPGNRRARAVRIVGALVAGFVTVAVCSTAVDGIFHASGIFPTSEKPMEDHLFVIALGYRLLIGVLGGYITARLAPTNGKRWALVLGLIGTVLSIAGAAATWNMPSMGPSWYPVALAVTALPCCWAGGYLEAGRPRDRS